MGEIGRQILDQGWRQGSVLRQAELDAILKGLEAGPAAGKAVAVVASQSCDVTHHNLSVEPFVEILIGEFVDRLNGNFTHGKNARRLQVEIQYRDGRTQPAEFVPWHRPQVERQRLADIEPDADRYLLLDDIRVLGIWLAQRYRRAAFPDEFNRRIVELGRKFRTLQKNLSPVVSGLYVQLHPDGELGPDEQYSVDLLALVPVFQKGKLDDVRGSVEALVELLKSTGMDVRGAALSEDKVPLATVRRMKRFPLEDLSLRGGSGDPLPAELG